MFAVLAPEEKVSDLGSRVELGMPVDLGSRYGSHHVAAVADVPAHDLCDFPNCEQGFEGDVGLGVHAGPKPQSFGVLGGGIEVAEVWRLSDSDKLFRSDEGLDLSRPHSENVADAGETEPPLLQFHVRSILKLQRRPELTGKEPVKTS